ncbi:hypothetical protein CHU_3303 [Cytophaga hutchinsonii ATCC 33406]|uniref:Uncharacterized protein n=2 Tax=Cytophaga hutchinsonii TaxID=985 RepID=A0A6N4SVT5_CYTH3|nr:hypothetical protein CHU_3303 [Cytophaga hutchinsonii ATCC 33406]SFX90444.1 hypothetical protein SAMN04487930_11288 [Cytophaga hutchinsonii ATCC 33406]
MINLTEYTDMSQLQLDKPTIQSYGVALSEKLTTDFFSSKDVIKGEEIVRFTDIEQLNFFILMNLFDRWKEEINRLKSPYFNYEEEEVSLALKSFVNKVSRHIAVRKEFFKPLVQKAIVDTLTYLISPVEFIEQEFGKIDQLSKSDLADKQKFFKLYKDTITLWFEKIEQSSKEFFSAKEIIDLYKASAPRQHTVQYSDPVVDKFNQLLKLNIAVAASQQANVDRLYKITPAETASVNETPLPAGSEQPVTKIPENRISQQFSKPALTLNEELRQGSTVGTSIAERLSKSKIEDIKSSIPLNLKFLFINVLFDGKVIEYNEALAHIEECSDFETAQQVLIEKYSKKNKWDMHTEEKNEFFQIIERKFY